MKIKVYDAMMGSGKTTKLIEDIAGLPADANVIYITPLLSECHRVAGTSYDEEDEYKRPIVQYQDTEDGIEEYVYDPSHILCNRRFRRSGIFVLFFARKNVLRFFLICSMFAFFTAVCW